MQTFSPATRTRESAPDLIRAVAIFLVLSVHFLLNNGFYSETVTGVSMYLMVLLRSFFMSCVPLFLMLTGYLSGHHRPSLHYVLKLRKTLTIYLLAAVVCIVFRVVALKQTYSLFSGIAAILDFSACGYGWYVEMYLGLFLLSPFLSILYGALQSSREKHLLLVSLLLLTCLPNVLNSFNLAVPYFWTAPATVDYYSKLFPEWWCYLYPITYFMLGRYLRENRRLCSGRLNLALLVLAIALSALYNCWRSHGSWFILGRWCDWGSLQVTIASFLLFHQLLNLELSRIPNWLSKGITWISEVSFGAYLLSWATDQALYPLLARFVSTVSARLPWYLVIVPCSFLLACLGSQLLLWIYRLLRRLVLPPADYILQKLSKR